MMGNRKRNLKRRGFLRGLTTASAAGLGLPFLSSLVARANETSERAKRLIVFFSPNEPIDREHWLPPGLAGTTLTQLAPVMSSLEPFRDKLTIIGDLEMQSKLQDPFKGGHVGTSHVLVGRRVTPWMQSSSEAHQFAGGISVDQHIGAQLDLQPLTLGAHVVKSDGHSRISFTGDSQPVAPIVDPGVVFDELFADALLPEDELAALKAQRLSVLDRVAEDLERTRARLSSEGRLKLEAHTDLIRDLELKIQSTTTLSCDPTDPGNSFDYQANQNFPTAVRHQIDVMVQALGCGITDVASLQLGNSGAANIVPQWPTEGVDISLDYHKIAHNYSEQGQVVDRENRIAVEAFFYRMFAYLLEQLESTPEGDGTTMLDNSIVLWTKPIGWKHDYTDLLFMVAGSGCGQIETGRFLSFPGVPHNNLLVNVCQWMGLEDEIFGNPEFCTGPLPIG